MGIAYAKGWKEETTRCVQGTINSSVLIDCKMGKWHGKRGGWESDYEGPYLPYSQVLTLACAQYT